MSLLKTTIDGRDHPYSATIAPGNVLHLTYPMKYKICSTSPGRSCVGPAFYVLSLLGLDFDLLLKKYFPVGQPTDRQETPVYSWCTGSSECTPLYLSTGISNYLQPAEAEVVLGQHSMHLPLGTGQCRIGGSYNMYIDHRFLSGGIILVFPQFYAKLFLYTNPCYSQP